MRADMGEYQPFTDLLRQLMLIAGGAAAVVSAALAIAKLRLPYVQHTFVCLRTT